MQTEIKNIAALEKVIAKLEKAQRKYPDDKRPEKIAKFKDQLSKLKASQPNTVSAIPSIASTGKNHARANSVSGIKHMKDWLKVFKTPGHALGF